MKYPENQEWQRECRVCGKVKCLKAEKVAELMRTVTDDTFRVVETFAREEPTFPGWRSQAGLFSVLMEQHMVGWSRCLEGVCFDCQAKTFPEEEQRLGDEDGIRSEHWRRWAFAVPLMQEQRRRDAIRAEVLADVAATGPVGEMIAADLRPPATCRVADGHGGKTDAPCAWARGGLAVTVVAEVNLKTAQERRAAGEEGAYPLLCSTITHAASGLALVQSYDTPDEAVEVARRLLPLADWTLPADKLAEALKSNPEASQTLAMEQSVARFR